MSNNFKLSALAVALATMSGSVIADVQYNGFPVIGPTNSVSVAIDGLAPGSTVSASIDATGVNVNSQANTTTSASLPTTGSNLSIPSISTPSSTQTVAYVDTYQRSVAQTQASQIYTPEKISFASKNVTGTENRTVNKTVDANYDAAGEFTGSNNVQTTADTGYVFDPLTATTLSEDSIVVGKENPGNDNALTVTKIDATTSFTTKTAANGLTVTNNTTGATTSVNANGVSLAQGSLLNNATNGVTLAGTGPSFIQVNNSSLVLHGGSTSTTQTIDDNGVNITSTAGGVTTIDTLGNIVTNGSVTGTTGNFAAINLNGQDLKTYIDTQDAATLTSANSYTNTQVANEAAARIAGDAATLAAANTYTDGQVANEAAARIAGDAATLAAANTYTDGQVANEAAARIAGDQSIRNDIATQVTTNALVVNGQSTFNGPVTAGTINANVGNITTINATTVKAATVDLGNSSNTVTTNTAPSANRLTARYNTTVNGTATTIYETQSGGVSTYYTINGTVATEFTNAAVISTLGTTVAPVAGGTTTTQAVVNTTTETLKQVNATAVTYGEVKTQQDAVTVNGTLNNAQAINVNVGTGAPVEVNNQSVSTGIIGTTNGNNVYGTVATAKTTGTNGTVTSNQTTTLTANGLSVKDTVSGASTTVTAGSVSTGTVTANTVVVGGKSVTAEFARVDAAAAAETTRVNTAISAGDAATLTSANAYTNVRANQLNSRVDDVERTAYRGIAIALAAQQQVPNIKAGQIAVFGGVGHYEGESAGALGVVGALNDRTSFSAALGFAGGNEIGGRVGVAYVFGGN